MSEAKEQQEYLALLEAVKDFYNENTPEGKFVADHLLDVIARETITNGSLHARQKALITMVNCRNVRTIDKNITALRREGLIETEAVRAENGASMANNYCVTPKGLNRIMEGGKALCKHDN